MIFKDKKYNGHYVFSPKPFLINKGQKFKFKYNFNFYSEIDNLIKLTKNELL